jgi:hypothetical protein
MSTSIRSITYPVCTFAVCIVPYYRVADYDGAGANSGFVHLSPIQSAVESPDFR